MTASTLLNEQGWNRDAIERQREWIARSPIPLAMVGILIALRELRPRQFFSFFRS